MNQAIFPGRGMAELARTLPPEVFDSGEGVDPAEGAAPDNVLRLGLGVVVPEGPGVLEGVGLLSAHPRSSSIGVRVIILDLPFLDLLRQIAVPL